MEQPQLRDFEVRWTTTSCMCESSLLLERNRENGHIFLGVFGIMDGGRMPCAAYTNPDLQNAFWERCTQVHEVTNLFVWNLFGEIIHTALNMPGDWHDSRISALSGLYYPLLVEKTL